MILNKLASEARSNSVSFYDYDPTITEQMGNVIGTAVDSVLISPVMKASTVAGSAVVAASEAIDSLTGEIDSNRTQFVRNQLAATVRKSISMEENANNAGRLTGAVYALGDMVGTFLGAGFFAKGIGKVATLAGGVQGYADYEKGLTQGLDKSTAAQKATVTGVTTALGGMIPLTMGIKLTPAAKMIAEAGDKWAKAGVYGKLIAHDVAYTAGAGIAAGMGSRGFTHDILKANGYDQMADQYNALDTEAMVVDGLMGIIFGGAAKFAEIRKTGMIDRYIDAALAKDNQLHQNNSAPGIALDVHSMNAGSEAFAKAFSDMAQGKPVDVEAILKDTNFAVKDTSDWHSLVADVVAKHYPNEPMFYTRDKIPVPGSIYNEIKDRLQAEKKPLLKTGERKKLVTEIQELQRRANELKKQRLEMQRGGDKGRGKEYSRKRKELRLTLNNLREREMSLRKEALLKQSTLARSSRGGSAFEAKADLTRLSQGIIPERFAKEIGKKIGGNLEGENTILMPTGETPGNEVTDAEFNQMVKNKGSEPPPDIHPDMMIPFIDERGNETHVNAAETLQVVRQEVAQAKTDKKLYDAAAACLLRNGL